MAVVDFAFVSCVLEFIYALGLLSYIFLPLGCTLTISTIVVTIIIAKFSEYLKVCSGACSAVTIAITSVRIRVFCCFFFLFVYYYLLQ